MPMWQFTRLRVPISPCCSAIWFACSFGAGILFRDFLDQFMLGGYPLADLGKHQHRDRHVRQILDMQRHPKVTPHMERPRQQHRGLWRHEQTFGHASITLLLHRQHRRQLACRQHAAMRGFDLR